MTEIACQVKPKKNILVKVKRQNVERETQIE